ncbi:putative protein N(5)-glutamine methyltransferase [Nonomuraea aurantiaca]|jgi:release factor glutamine methyltransferase|uniref:putative protein N(5)-glutamine methyltransferase n=1 Tax=Nonomuraea aurantiaca TaxID=2878562 RepID=UPI001CDA2D6A|nr:putative protein N(5)-glutamine methyltransferase [Nonomuraea aurantiaca]MCA2230377.1 putative protein N(5)-glutamine methyltransferase [Nonomuraea aurantiaca]
MSVFPSPVPPSAIITRLRAAGCVFAEDEAALLMSTARTPDELTTMVDQRVAGLPLEHVLGWAEFCGLRIAVDPEVFVPRRRTEFLIDQAEAAALSGPSPTVILDLCCGTGAMGAALAATLSKEAAPDEKGVELHAADLHPAAVRCARRNLTPIGGQVYEGDLYEPLPATLRSRVDILIASPPYVPTEAIRLLPSEARVHEPLVALDGGADGLDVVRRVIAEAPAWLAPGGHLLVETSERQASRTAEDMAAAGLIPRVTASEDRYATVVMGTRPIE